MATNTSLTTSNQNELSQAIGKLSLNISLQGISEQITPFSGNSKSYHKWIKSIEKLVLLYNSELDSNECIRVALHSSKSTVSDFISRFLQNNRETNWQNLKNELAARFSESLDFNTKIAILRKLKQRHEQSFQVFGEVILGKAIETYGEDALDSTVIQSDLIQIFTKGVTSKSIAKKISRKNPDTLQEAIELALNENKIEIRLKAQGIFHDEPMEVDNIREKTPNSNRAFQTPQNQQRPTNNFGQNRSHQNQYRQNNFPPRYPSNYHNRQYDSTRQFLNSASNFKNRSNYKTNISSRQNTTSSYPRTSGIQNNSPFNTTRSPSYNPNTQNPKVSADSSKPGDLVCYRCHRPGHVRKFCRVRLN